MRLLDVPEQAPQSRTKEMDLHIIQLVSYENKSKILKY